MTHRDRLIETLKCNKIGGQVPHLELVFFLTMESFGKVHPAHRKYDQWYQMSYEERKLHMNEMADIYIKIAEKYDQSAIFVHPNPNDFDTTLWMLELLREKTGNEYFLGMHGDPTWEVPDGDKVLDFSIKMYEDPDILNDQSKRSVETCLENAQKLHEKGHLLDGFFLCSDYALNVNPFFSPDKFEELIHPYLKEIIAEYRKLGYYSIKHTDGNIMPIINLIADCKPDAIHSIDPQGGMSIPEVRKSIGDEICLIGNVNCGLLQTGAEQECKDDILRSLKEGMETGRGYVFATSNCAYTGLPLTRYEMMVDLWRKYGSY